MSLIKLLKLDREFSKPTMILNGILEQLHLRICKDCQKLINADNLRCGKCEETHRIFKHDELRAELENERAEVENDYYYEE